MWHGNLPPVGTVRTPVEANVAPRSLRYSGQLAAYVTALRAADMECAGCWLHLPVGGALVEVILPHTSSQQ